MWGDNGNFVFMRHTSLYVTVKYG